MPLLEINQSRHICASVRLDEATAAQVDQYAAFIHASPDDVVDKALNYVFSKDRDFPGLPEDGTRQAGCPRFACAKRPEQWCDGAADKEARSRGRVHGFCARSEGVIVHPISWWCKNGASHRKNFDTPPLKGRVSAPRCTYNIFKDITIEVHLGAPMKCEENMAVLNNQARRDF